MPAEWLELHPVNPQKRFLEKIAASLRDGAVIVYPTDSCYALGCRLGEKRAAERIHAIRQFGKHHLYTLVCRGLSELGTYAKVDNAQFAVVKSLVPGPYTLVLRASPEAPRHLLHEKRKTVGLRVPDHVIAQAILATLGEPLLSCTLMLPPEQAPICDPKDEFARLDHLVDVVAHGGDCGSEPTTILDLTEGEPRLVRRGKGDVTRLFPSLEEAGER